MFRVVPTTRRSNLVTRNNDMYSLFDDIFNDAFFSTPSIGNGSFKVDIMDQEDKFVIEAELPGINKDNLSVDYKDNQLTIKVEKSEENVDEKAKYIHKERHSTTLQRVFRMKGVNREGLKAKLDNGILTIIAPKLDEVINSYKVEIE